jgi:hypothetical protein
MALVAIITAAAATTTTAATIVAATAGTLLIGILSWLHGTYTHNCLWNKG